MEGLTFNIKEKKMFLNQEKIFLLLFIIIKIMLNSTGLSVKDKICTLQKKTTKSLVNDLIKQYTTLRLFRMPSYSLSLTLTCPSPVPQRIHFNIAIPGH